MMITYNRLISKKLVGYIILID